MRVPSSVLVGIVAAALGSNSLAAELQLRVSPCEATQFLAVTVPATAEAGAKGLCVLVPAGADGNAIPAQLSAAVGPDGLVDAQQQCLLSLVPPLAETPQPPVMSVVTETGSTAGPAFRFEQLDDARLKLWQGETPVFVYNFGTITDESVPAGDGRNSRSCYVHPIWGVNGEVITDDFPKDHFHHHGLFWTWPHVGVDGEEYDLWVANNIQQRFIRWIHRDCGPLAAGVAVENGWFVGDRQVMTERVWLRAFAADDEQRVIDVTLVLIPGNSPVTLWGSAGKSYGGLTMRFDVTPRRDAVIRAPGRITRHVGEGLASTEDLANTPLPWADLSSQFPGMDHRSGAALLVHPGHPDFPPSWLTRCYGALCIGWPGVEPQTLAPGVPVTLQYRLWIHKTEVDEDVIARQVQSYQASARAELVK